MGERKFVHMVQVTWPIWPPCPYLVKTWKNKSFSLEPKCRWHWKLVCSIGCASTTKFILMMTLGWPWPILRQGQIWSPMLLYGEKGKTMDFSEIIVVCGRSMQSTKWVYELLWMSTVKVIHWLWSEVTRIQHSLETARLTEAKFHVEPPWDGEWKCVYKWFMPHDQDGRHVHIW